VASTPDRRDACILVPRIERCEDVSVSDTHHCVDPAGPVSVLVVDDQPPFRAVAQTVVAVSHGFEVIGEAESGEAAVTAATTLHPSVVLMDINLPGMSGIEATRQILDERPDTVVILLSTYDERSLPADTATCGAARYVHKEDFGPAILREIWDAVGP
jgi:DNA-binding NarL/FixJ family response regulator